MKHELSRQETETVQACEQVSYREDCPFVDLESSISLAERWKSPSVQAVTTLHQISPFIGKMKPLMAQALIETFSEIGDTVYDPFCGSGTVALEAWIAGRVVIACDLSSYAVHLTRGKLYPIVSLPEALKQIERVSQKVGLRSSGCASKGVPNWVRDFFHPETLQKIVVWSDVLLEQESYFLMSCLLGILHHQRPGFLSFPSSHIVPYLRTRTFPRESFPSLYEYRSVRDRLERKIRRVLKRLPSLNLKAERICVTADAREFQPSERVKAIITSPPYMQRLDYARDNRLRLWFLGVENWAELDKVISPNQTDFLNLIRISLEVWHNSLRHRGLIVLVLGMIEVPRLRMALPDVVERIATRDVGGYVSVYRGIDTIPVRRRVGSDSRNGMQECILVLRRR